MRIGAAGFAAPVGLGDAAEAEEEEEEEDEEEDDEEEEEDAEDEERVERGTGEAGTRADEEAKAEDGGVSSPCRRFFICARNRRRESARMPDVKEKQNIERIMHAKASVMSPTPAKELQQLS